MTTRTPDHLRRADPPGAALMPTTAPSRPVSRPTPVSRIPDPRRFSADLGAFDLPSGSWRGRIVIPGSTKLDLLRDATKTIDGRITRAGIAILVRRGVLLSAPIPEKTVPAQPPPATVDGRLKNAHSSLLAWRKLDRVRARDPLAAEAADHQLDLLRADVDALLELTESTR